jgi:DNA-binding response OmpR family regulator
VARLRRKIETGEDRLIQSVPGVGYVLRLRPDDGGREAR